MTLKFLILPGIGNSDENHWQSHWESLSSDFQRIDQDNWYKPVCSEWKEKLELRVSELGENIVLIAHSLSCLLVAHWAASTTLKIAGALLVAPPDPKAEAFPKEALGFADVPLAKLDFHSIVIASESDPYADIAFSRNCAQQWGAEFINVGDSGHINSASGFGVWPYGEKILEDIVEKLAA